MVSIKFVEIFLLNNKEVIIYFLKLNFGIIEYFLGILIVGGIILLVEMVVERYNFLIIFVLLIFDVSIYWCYKVILVFKMKCFVEFLKVLGIEKIEVLIIFKKNLFKVIFFNVYFLWRFVLYEFFKDESFREFVVNLFVSDKLFKIIIEGVGKFDGGEVCVFFLVEVVDKDNFYF